MQNSAFEQEVLRLTNEFRQKNGLKALVLDQSLDKAANNHSKDMALQDYFSHTGKNGSNPRGRAQTAGYETGFVGENIAAGYASAKAVVDGWINSPGHRANMLNTDYNEIGIGHYFLANDTGSTNYGHYWTQVFGKGELNNSSPKPSPKPKPGASNASVINGTDKADKLIGGARGQRIMGKKGNDIILAKGGNDRVYGDHGNDRLLGDGGNDYLLGGSGNDQLLGGTGSDRLLGGSGNDVLRGSNRQRSTEKDILTGGSGRDIFVLGDKNGTFYNDGNAKSLGVQNYALITDLNVRQRDIIQLSNDHKYRLGSSPKGAPSGRALFIDNGPGQQDELIAVIRGSGNLNLNSSTFRMV